MTDTTRIHEGDPERVATILPGRGYTPDAPLLHYAIGVLRRRGWTVREVWWQGGTEITGDVAVTQATEALDAVDAPTQMIVAKSLGTLAMPHAVDHGIHGVWLTPLLVDPEIELAATRLTGLDLLVGGTADSLWDAEVAASSPARVLQIEGANHGLEVDDSVLDSIDVLRSVTYHVEKVVELVDPRG